jgi:DNA-binding LacI/PurR family transcriptional regulator
VDGLNRFTGGSQFSNGANGNSVNGNGAHGASHHFDSIKGASNGNGHAPPNGHSVHNGYTDGPALRKESPRRNRARGSGRVTISDIAREAGVSKTAVSFAFNVPGRLSKETTEHILAVAKRIGYTPNPIARSLNTRRTNAIGLVVPQDIPEVMANPFYADLMRGIGEVCKSEGLSLMLVPPMRGSLVDATYAALVDGCIIAGLEADDPVVQALSQRRIPCVMVDAEGPRDVASVMIDDCRGARSALKHLLEQGHRDIVIASIGASEDDVVRVDALTGTMKRRFDGFALALAEAGLSLHAPEIRVLETDASVEGGRALISRLTEGDALPSAILCLSDAMAWGVIDACRARGISIPEQLAVVGFDDLPPSSLMHPALTTVRQPTIEKGRRAAELFVELVRCNGECEPQRITLPVELIIRDSSRSALRVAQ